ncbi:MAG: hypothetical protein GY943_25865, partial [Chloroflexi bacterium]|nr:hypothetical protein [Chloroflexota bacterium]
MQKIVITGKTIKLDPAQLIQSGGEGMVFDMGNTAVKLYHQPTKQHRAKLTYLLKPGASIVWPDCVLGPKTAVYNRKNQL